MIVRTGIKRLTIESTRQDIIPIQMLRGIAASMVVFVHLDVQLKRLGYGTLDAPWLASGVDIFFVISGFIMWVSVARRPATSAGEFMNALSAGGRSGFRRAHRQSRARPLRSASQATP